MTSAATVTVVCAEPDESTLRELAEQFGGAPIADAGPGLRLAFESCSNGVDCAVTMQRQAARTGVDLRVGVTVGEGRHSPDGWRSTPIAEAARLCVEAVPGEILVAPLVQALLGSRGGHAFEPSGPPELGARALAWEPEQEPEPMPAAATSGSPGPLPNPVGDVRQRFVGRAAERAELADAWRATAAGQGRFVLLSGEPGIGKTRLLSELAADAQAAGATVLYGRCDEEPLIPYQPFAEALAQLITGATDQLLAEHTERWGGALARVATVLETRVTTAVAAAPIDPEADRHHLFEAACHLLELTAAEQPVLLLLDDLQWAKKPTVLLLRRIHRLVVTTPVMVVVAYRDSELGRVHPMTELLADLRREPDVARVSLAGLGVDDVVELVRLTAQGGVVETVRPLAEAVYGETEGNPFFIGEVLRHLVESAAVATDGGQWVLRRPLDELGLPEGVREVVGRRLSYLSDAANRLLAVAAVIGARFDLDVVEAVADAPSGDEALDALDEAVQARVVVEDDSSPGRFIFAHALIRQTLVEELTTTRRVRLHRRIAEAIERVRAHELPRHYAMLAHHWTEAAAGGAIAEAARYGWLAAQDALNRVAHEDAVRLAERALDTIEPGDRTNAAARCELLLLLAEAHLRLFDTAAETAAAWQAVEVAREVNLPVHMARAAGYLGGWPEAGIFHHDVDDAIEESLRGLGHDDPALRSLLRGTQSINRTVAGFDLGRVDELSAEAVRLADIAGDWQSYSTAAYSRVWALMGTGRSQELLAVCEDVLRRVENSGIAPWVLQAYRVLGPARLANGDRDGFDAIVELAEPLARDQGIRLHQSITAEWRAAVAIMEGRLDDAEAHAERSLALSPHDANTVTVYGVQLLWIRREQGLMGELIPLMEGALADKPGIPSYRGGLALAHVNVGDLDAARRVLQPMIDDGFAELAASFTAPGGLAGTAEVVAELGDVEAAEALLPLIEPFSGRPFVVVTAFFVPGAADRYVGMLLHTLGRTDEAIQHLEAAIEQETALRGPTLVAHSQRWLDRVRGAT